MKHQKEEKIKRNRKAEKLAFQMDSETKWQLLILNMGFQNQPKSVTELLFLWKLLYNILYFNL